MISASILVSFFGLFGANQATADQSAFVRRIDPACVRILPTQVVQRAAGQTGVTLVPRDSRHGAHGTCNYAISGGTVILFVSVNRLTDPSFYESYRRNCGYLRPGVAIAGLGDDAMACSAYGGGADQAVVVQKGPFVVVVQSAKRLDLATRRVRESYFSTEQLTEFARRMVKRL